MEPSKFSMITKYFNITWAIPAPIKPPPITVSDFIALFIVVEDENLRDNTRIVCAIFSRRKREAAGLLCIKIPE